MCQAKWLQVIKNETNLQYLYPALFKAIADAKTDEDRLRLALHVIIEEHQHFVHEVGIVLACIQAKVTNPLDGKGLTDVQFRDICAEYEMRTQKKITNIMLFAQLADTVKKHPQFKRLLDADELAFVHLLAKSKGQFQSEAFHSGSRKLQASVQLRMDFIDTIQGKRIFCRRSRSAFSACLSLRQLAMTKTSKCWHEWLLVNRNGITQRHRHYGTK